MDKIRKILKIILIGVITFAGMTVLFAALISYTSLTEKLSYIGLVTIVTTVCIITSYLVGTLFNNKGILIGLITSIITAESLFIAVQMIFLGEINSINPDIYYVISILFGTVGGIVGVNKNK